MGFVSFIGSVCLVAVFIGSGLGKISDPNATAGFIKTTKFYDLAVTNGVPLNEGDNLVKFTIALGAIMLFAATLFILNIGRPFAALILAAFTAAFTVFVHVNLENPAATSMDNTIHCMKNTAIIGGLLMGAFSGCGGQKGSPAVAAKKQKKD